MVVFLTFLAACGGGGSGNGDTASSAEQPPVASVDSGADAAPSAHGLTVRAKGSLVDDVGPTLQVKVDGQAVGSAEVRSGHYADYTFAMAAPAASAVRVDVIFSNGAAGADPDRQLNVESLSAASQTLRPTSPGAVIDLGNAQRVYDGHNVIPGQSNLVSDAALRIRIDPAPAVLATPVVDIAAFGAVCDGRVDNSAAIARAIASAKTQGLPVWIPAGTCAYGDVIRLDGVKLRGTGDASVLHALNWRRESIFMSGDGAEVSRLKLTAVKAPSRQADWESTRITLFGARNFVIDRLTIEGSAAAGIQTAQGANHGTITNNTIKDTLSDSIHLTDKASHITVENNRIENAGDDGIAVVSYRNDGGLVNHITARNNIILNNKWGRQMSVVGGSDVLYENNYLANNLAGFACLYVAQEAGFATYGTRNVIAQRNTLKNCGGTTTGHGAVMVYSDGQEANSNISLIRNDISQQGQTGIRIFSAMNNAIRVESNRVQGASPDTDIKSPGVTLIPYSSGPVGFTMP